MSDFYAHEPWCNTIHNWPGECPPAREPDPPVDVQKLLDEVAELLAKPPSPGEFIHVIQTRQVKAQHLLLKAQLAILRAEVNG